MFGRSPAGTLRLCCGHLLFTLLCNIQEQKRQDRAGRRGLCHSSSPGCPFSQGVVCLSLRKMDHADYLPARSDIQNLSTYFYVSNPLIQAAPVKTNLLGGSHQLDGAAQGLCRCGGTCSHQLVQDKPLSHGAAGRRRHGEM